MEEIHFVIEKRNKLALKTAIIQSCLRLVKNSVGKNMRQCKQK